MKSNEVQRSIRELETVRAKFGTGDGPTKTALLKRLTGIRVADFGAGRARATWIKRLHESLIFLRAYPDDAHVLAAAESALANLPSRFPVAVARRLDAEGLPGSGLSNPFDYPVAAWLVDRFPDDVRIDWDGIDDETSLQNILPLLAGPAGELALDADDVSTRQWLKAAAGDFTDLTWLVRQIRDLNLPPRTRDFLYDNLLLPLRWVIRERSASRSYGLTPDQPFFHDSPLARRVSDLRRFLRDHSPAARRCAPAEATRFIDLAVAALAARSREMFPISHANPKDILAWPAGRGLEVVTYGIRPERRMLLEGLWGFLLVKNGVPVGYGCYSALLGSAEVAFNIFESFRQGEAAFCYAGLLSTIRAHVGATSFSVLKFQIGENNEEAIESGAFWFYEKLGFEPLDVKTLALVQRERARIAGRKGYRTSAATLRRIAKTNIYLHLGKPTHDVLGEWTMGSAGMSVTRAAGGNRRLAIAEARRKIGGLTGIRPPRDEITGEYCLFLSSLPGLDRWSAPDRRRLGRVVLARGGDSECDYARLQSEHPLLRRAIRTLLR